MKRGTPKHPKLYDLLGALDLPIRQRPLAVGFLELLWHFTAEFAPQGNIGKYSDERIEAALDWTGRRGKLIEALTNSGWCAKSDRYRLIVHDWHDHADDATKKKLQRLSLPFLSVIDEVTGLCPQPSPKTADTDRTALPSQSRSQSQSQPNAAHTLAPVPRKGLPDPGCQDFEARFDRLYKNHIITGFKAEGKLRYIQVITEAVNPDAIADAIDRSHSKWKAYWVSDPKAFKPGIAKWFEDEYYAREPPSSPNSRASPGSVPAPNMYPDADEWKRDFKR